MRKLRKITTMFLIIFSIMVVDKTTASATGNNVIYKVGDVLHQDSKISIMFDGITGDAERYNINFTISNMSTKSFTIQARETSINGIMVDPICSIDVSPGKTAKDRMEIWGDDAKSIPKDGVKDIETKFLVFESDDWSNEYYTEFIKMQYTHTHSYTKEEIYKQATCTENGTMKHICACESYYTSEIPATGHTYSGWQIVMKPNCANEGSQYHYCQNCYQSEYQNIPRDLNEHNWRGWITTNPTALKNGKTERSCYYCGKKEIKKIAKLRAKVTLSHKKKKLKNRTSFYLYVKNRTYGDAVKKYTTSNKKVASVSKSGIVKANKKGKAKITVTMKSGCRATCTVTVK